MPIGGKLLPALTAKRKCSGAFVFRRGWLAAYMANALRVVLVIIRQPFPIAIFAEE